jgi:hypothetical protein
MAGLMMILMMNTSNVLELSKRIGTIVEFSRDGLTFHVRIVDARMSYGSVECRIEPLAGSGARWVRESSLKGMA